MSRLYFFKAEVNHPTGIVDTYVNFIKYESDSIKYEDDEMPKATLDDLLQSIYEDEYRTEEDFYEWLACIDPTTVDWWEITVPLLGSYANHTKFSEFINKLEKEADE